MFILCAHPIAAPAQITAASAHWQSSQWWRNTATLDLDFINDRYWLNGTQYSGVSNFITGSGATFSRNSVGTYFNSSGILTTASANVPRLDHSPISPYAAEGILIEESRTNGLRNNTMQGALVSTSITAQTISSITDSSGLAIVTTSAAHGLAVGNTVWVSGASPANYNGAFSVASVPSSTSFTYTMATDPGANATTVGSYVAMTGGTQPSYWATASPRGIRPVIVGTGSESGISYVDIRFIGVPSTIGPEQVQFETTTQIAAAQGQTWTGSLFTELAAGSLANSGISTTSISINDYNSSGTSVANNDFGVAQPTGNSLESQKVFATWTLTGSTAAYTRFLYYFVFTVGTPVDFTIRFGMPQLELGAFPTSVIPTSGSAVTRSPDVFNLPTSAAGGWYSAGVGTLLAYGIYDYLGAGEYPGLADLTGSAGNSLSLYMNSNGAKAAALYAGGTVQFSSQPGGVYVAGNLIKQGVAFATNNVNAAMDGVLGTLGTSATIPSFTQLDVGADVASPQGIRHVRRITYFPTRQPDYSLPDYTR